METAADSPLRDPRPWSISHWIVFIIAVLLVQSGFVVFLSRAPAGIQPKHPATSSFKLLAGTPADTLILKQLAIIDPALFGSASSRNFSGLAWVRRPDFDIEIPAWSEPPAYLELSGHLPRYYQNESPQVSENTLPDKMAPGITPTVTTTPKPASTLLMDLLPGGRRILAVGDIPLQPYSDVLGVSVVQAVVDEHGLVISARLIVRSGSKKADADGLNIAKAARFEPRKELTSITAGTTSTDWAVFAFQWFTVPMESTGNLKK